MLHYLASAFFIGLLLLLLAMITDYLVQAWNYYHATKPRKPPSRFTDISDWLNEHFG